MGVSVVPRSEGTGVFSSLRRATALAAASSPRMACATRTRASCELGTPEVLSHKRLGHELGGMAGIYSHVTPVMRKELMSALTECWQQALEARAAISPHSPVAVLGTLLQAHVHKQENRLFKVNRDSVALR